MTLTENQRQVSEQLKTIDTSQYTVVELFNLLDHNYSQGGLHAFLRSNGYPFIRRDGIPKHIKEWLAHLSTLDTRKYTSRQLYDLVVDRPYQFTSFLSFLARYDIHYNRKKYTKEQEWQKTIPPLTVNNHIDMTFKELMNVIRTQGYEKSMTVVRRHLRKNNISYNQAVRDHRKPQPKPKQLNTNNKRLSKDMITYLKANRYEESRVLYKELQDTFQYGGSYNTFLARKRQLGVKQKVNNPIENDSTLATLVNKYHSNRTITHLHQDLTALGYRICSKTITDYLKRRGISPYKRPNLKRDGLSYTRPEPIPKPIDQKLIAINNQLTNHGNTIVNADTYEKYKQDLIPHTYTFKDTYYVLERS